MSLENVLSITLGLFGLGAILMLVGSASAPGDVRRQRWLKFVSYFIIVHVVLGAALVGGVVPGLLAVLVAAAGAVEVWRALGPSHGSAPVRAIRAAYVVIAAAFVSSLATLDGRTVAYLYLVVAAFDGFSQVVGQVLGRHALAPRLSPRKTIEGLAGGILAAVAMAAVLAPLAGLEGQVGLVSGALVAVFALAGDLGASWVKRRAGIKDFGATLPGQGGVLDRFDSFIAAGALAGPLLGVLRPAASL